MSFSSSPIFISLSPPIARRYFAIMEKANDYETKYLAEIEAKVMMANQRYYDSKGWFWTCNNLCTNNYNKLQGLKAIMADKEAKVGSGGSGGRVVVVGRWVRSSARGGVPLPGRWAPATQSHSPLEDTPE